MERRYRDWYRVVYGASRHRATSEDNSPEEGNRYRAPPQVYVADARQVEQTRAYSEVKLRRRKSEVAVASVYRR